MGVAWSAMSCRLPEAIHLPEPFHQRVRTRERLVHQILPTVPRLTFDDPNLNCTAGHAVVTGRCVHPGAFSLLARIRIPSQLIAVSLTPDDRLSPDRLTPRRHRSSVWVTHDSELCYK